MKITESAKKHFPIDFFNIHISRSSLKYGNFGKSTENGTPTNTPLITFKPSISACLVDNVTATPQPIHTIRARLKAILSKKESNNYIQITPTGEDNDKKDLEHKHLLIIRKNKNIMLLHQLPKIISKPTILSSPNYTNQSAQIDDFANEQPISGESEFIPTKPKITKEEQKKKKEKKTNFPHPRVNYSDLFQVDPLIIPDDQKFHLPTLGQQITTRHSLPQSYKVNANVLHNLKERFQKNNAKQNTEIPFKRNQTCTENPNINIKIKLNSLKHSPSESIDSILTSRRSKGKKANADTEREEDNQIYNLTFGKK